MDGMPPYVPPSDEYIDALPPSTCVIERVAALGAPPERFDAPPRRVTPRRPADGGALPLPGLDALDAIPDERIPAAMAHLAASIAALAARQAEVTTRKPRWRTVAWAAAESGMSKPYFYERADPRHLEHEAFRPFLRKRGRAVRVEEAAFRRWLARR
jgi:hypothetical protein